MAFFWKNWANWSSWQHWFSHWEDGDWWCKREYVSKYISAFFESISKSRRVLSTKLLNCQYLRAHFTFRAIDFLPKMDLLLTKMCKNGLFCKERSSFVKEFSGKMHLPLRFLTFTQHSVENLRHFLLLRFYVKSIVANLESCKCHLDTFKVLTFRFEKFQPWTIAKICQNQNSEPNEIDKVPTL